MTGLKNCPGKLFSCLKERQLSSCTKGRLRPAWTKGTQLFSVPRARRCFLCLCVSVVTLLLVTQSLILYCYFATSGRPQSVPFVEGQQTPFIQYFGQREWRESDVKEVLIWDEGIPFSYGDTDFAHCPVSRCHITHDKGQLQKSDAVLFTSRGLWNAFRGYPMPAWRAPHQVWVLGTMEAPPHTVLDWSKFQGVFNWTMHYRRYADLLSVYGVLVPLNASKDFRKLQEQETNRNYAREKSRMVAWVASNCIDDARRQRVVQELSRYVHIDTYGACGDLDNFSTCSGRCEDDLLKDYRFYLSLENARCRDYVTEKFFAALRRGLVPITNSDVHSMGILPVGSYIQISDFSSIKQLAAYLKQLAANETAYNQYHSWRRSYSVSIHPDRWCQLCTELHNKSRTAQVYTDLHGWLQNDTCQPWSLCNYIKRMLEGYALYYRLIS